MPKNLSVQNNFIRGLITEATPLNFPENACTDTSNCVFSLIGDVTRRPGINYETNYVDVPVGISNEVLASFRWVNAGGDGLTELLVQQIGQYLYFFKSSASTVANPLSSQLLPTTVYIPIFTATGNTAPISATECQFAAGNGYLFVFHPECDPFYCSYSSGLVTAAKITVQVRDFLGYYPEPGNLGLNVRPQFLTDEHDYNLQNQGWTGVPAWFATETFPGGTSYPGISISSTDISCGLGLQSYTVSAGLTGITPGQTVHIGWLVSSQLYQGAGSSRFSVVDAGGNASGTVTSYSGTSLVIDVATSDTFSSAGGTFGLGYTSILFNITPGVSSNAINTFFSQLGYYPANCDIWYTFKDDTGSFNPSTTLGSVLTTTTPAPRGHFILNAFNQNQSVVSQIGGVSNLSTIARPSAGTWFQGRVWFTGINGSQAPTGDLNFYTWSESIYFSQIITPGDVSSFGYCYQQNDPTDENFFDILPTDGGVLTIQGCGNIFKLFPIQNGMLVFAANGVWFLTGSQGIGFTATDYTITKISAVKTLSSTSFIDVLGLPFFWNEEGIYRVTPAQGQGIGLVVEPLTVGTILGFYNEIPLDSKVYARGDYDPINYVVKWIYRSTQETGLVDRYEYDSALNFNIYNKAFYPYSFSSGGGLPSVGGLFYLNYPNSLTSPDPGFKYLAYVATPTFAEENDDTNWVDWGSVTPTDYASYFTTGYNMHGKGIVKWQPTYVYMYSRNTDPFAYSIQGVWDFAISSSSGRYSTKQVVINGLGQPNFGAIYRRHKIRGHGESLQITVSSVSGYPFDIVGWALYENIDAGV